MDWTSAVRRGGGQGSLAWNVLRKDQNRVLREQVYRCLELIPEGDGRLELISGLQSSTESTFRGRWAELLLFKTLRDHSIQATWGASLGELTPDFQLLHGVCEVISIDEQESKKAGNLARDRVSDVVRGIQSRHKVYLRRSYAHQNTSLQPFKRYLRSRLEAVPSDAPSTQLLDGKFKSDSVDIQWTIIPNLYEDMGPSFMAGNAGPPMALGLPDRRVRQKLLGKAKKYKANTLVAAHLDYSGAKESFAQTLYYQYPGNGPKEGFHPAAFRSGGSYRLACGVLAAVPRYDADMGIQLDLCFFPNPAYQGPDLLLNASIPRAEPPLRPSAPMPYPTWERVTP